MPDANLVGFVAKSSDPERAAARRLRSVCVVTGTRAEFGLLRPVCEAIRASGLELRLLVAGMHLAPRFGDTVRDIEAAGFAIDGRIEMTPEEDTHAAMALSIGTGICGMVRAMDRLHADAVLILGDRVEAFAGAVSGAALGRAVAHIHGGERTRGGLDESLRHAITKVAHLHFVATEACRERVIKMGERPDRVYAVGAPGLDTILGASLPSRADLSQRLGFPLPESYLFLVLHPVTTEAADAALQMRELLEGAKGTGLPAIAAYPNADAGGRTMIDVLEGCRAEPWLRVFPSLDHRTYLALLRDAAALVGNTSSGIIEAASFHVPVVNIGSRQDGRERSTNVIDAPHDRAAIRKAVERALTDAEFRAQVQRCVNPYGDGRASERIVETLRSIELTRDLLQKQITY